MARTSKKISQLDPAPGGPVAGDQFVIERGAVANYRIDWNAIVAAASAGVDGTFLDSSLNLSDLADVPTARANLGLGSAALLAAAAVLQSANNLADVANVATARHSLGLDAVDAPTFAGLTLGSTPLVQDGAANVLALRNGANAQEWRVYSSFADVGNNEFFRVAFASAIARLEATRNGTGSFRHIVITVGGLDSFAVMNTSARNAQLLNTGAFTWSSTSAATGTADLFLFRDGAGLLAQRNGVNAQALRLYNTFTDLSNYERVAIDWQANSGIASIQTAAAGTGTLRNLRLAGAAVELGIVGAGIAWTVNAGRNFVAATDNSFDIGAAGANRPRNGFFGGTLSFGALTVSADAPITGFITITDSGGVTRKLAVIA